MATQHGSTFFGSDDSEYTAASDRVIRGDGSYALLADGCDSGEVAEALADGSMADSDLEWFDDE